MGDLSNMTLLRRRFLEGCLDKASFGISANEQLIRVGCGKTVIAALPAVSSRFSK